MCRCYFLFVELQACCEKIEACTRVNRSLCESPISQSLAAKSDLEMIQIQERLEFPPHVPVSKDLLDGKVYVHITAWVVSLVRGILCEW